MSSEASADDNSTRTGWLWKLGEKDPLKRWRHRFFTIQDGALLYYKKEADADSGTDPKGVIDLDNCTVEQPPESKHRQKHVFELYAPMMERTFILRADSGNETQQWMQTINRAMLKIRKSRVRPLRSVSTVLEEVEQRALRRLTINRDDLNAPSSGDAPQVSQSFQTKGGYLGDGDAGFEAPDEAEEIAAEQAEQEDEAQQEEEFDDPLRSNSVSIAAVDVEADDMQHRQSVSGQQYYISHVDTHPDDDDHSQDYLRFLSETKTQQRRGTRATERPNLSQPLLVHDDYGGGGDSSMYAPSNATRRDSHEVSHTGPCGCCVVS